MDDPTSAALLHIPDLDAATKQRMPTIMDFNFLPDMGRMNGNWQSADPTGYLQARCEQAAAIMSLLRSAQLNGHDPYAYLKDVLTRLPTHKANDIAALLPHRWLPASHRLTALRQDGITGRLRSAAARG